jgi:hypothetical protein
MMLDEGGTDGRTPLVGFADDTDVKRAEQTAIAASSDAASADAAALEAAIAAANAEYEAKFGSVAVGRLLAGSLAVNQFIQSTNFSSGFSGWRINADGSAEFNSITVRGGLIAGGGVVFLDAEGLRLPGWGSFTTDPTALKRSSLNWYNTSTGTINGWVRGTDGGEVVTMRAALEVALRGANISLQGATGNAAVWINGNRLDGTKTTSGPTHNNGTGETGNPLPSSRGSVTDTASPTVANHTHLHTHNHNTTSHTHTITI